LNPGPAAVRASTVTTGLQGQTAIAMMSQSAESRPIAGTTRGRFQYYVI